MRRVCVLFFVAVGATVPLFAQSKGAAEKREYSVEYILKTFRPRHADIEIDTPEPKAVAQCKVVPFEEGKMTGWLVTGPAGQPLRRFLDTNGDDLADRWSFFHNGLEVYRDIDTNFNGKIDQSRWLNDGGTRWGVDTDEDGRIDVWKMISAEEVSRNVVRALITQEVAVLTPLLVTKEDCKSLGISGSLETALMAAVANPAAGLRKAANSKVIHAKSSWMRFDASPPGVVPAETYGTKGDLIVYQNVMAMVDNGDPRQPGLVMLGELIKVGDVWKMTGMPAIADPRTGQIELAAGIVRSHILTGGAADAHKATAGVSEKTQKLVEQLRNLMENPPAEGAGKSTWEKYFLQVDAVLVELFNASTTDEERTQWVRQLLDTITSGVQAGRYNVGVRRLRELEGEIKKVFKDLEPVAAYRRMLGEYAVDMRQAEGDEAREKIHQKWLKDLEGFLEKYPKGDDAPDAALQLAVALEFAGKVDRAGQWYRRLTDDYDGTPAAQRAEGAVRRIDLVGKTLSLSGSGLSGGTIDVRQFRGTMLLVFFWDTKSKLCAADLPQLKALYNEYHKQGFEILGVNLDASKADVAPYLSQNGVSWPQLHEPGGLESPPARSFGIISLPTTFLVDKEGKVLNRSASLADVRDALEKAYKSK
jgi:glutathione peroxidase-family protein